MLSPARRRALMLEVLPEMQEWWAYATGTAAVLDDSLAALSLFDQLSENHSQLVKISRREQALNPHAAHTVDWEGEGHGREIIMEIIDYLDDSELLFFQCFESEAIGAICTTTELVRAKWERILRVDHSMIFLAGGKRGRAVAIQRVSNWAGDQSAVTTVAWRLR